MSEGEFWACVRKGAKPDRGVPEVPAQALPTDIVFLLINRVGLPEADVAGMTKEQAVARLDVYWAEGR
jgi:hypothetical protein